MCTYEIILSRLGVPNYHEHFVVHIFVWNNITILVSRSIGDDGVIFNLKLAYIKKSIRKLKGLKSLTVLLSYDNHGLGDLVNILWLRSYRNKLNIVMHSQYFTTRLGFNILFGDVFALIIKEPM